MGRSGNLCESSLILVGCVNSRAQNPVDVARTDVRFSVARVVEGDAPVESVADVVVVGDAVAVAAGGRASLT